MYFEDLNDLYKPLIALIGECELLRQKRFKKGTPQPLNKTFKVLIFNLAQVVLIEERGVPHLRLVPNLKRSEHTGFKHTGITKVTDRDTLSKLCTLLQNSKDNEGGPLIGWQPYKTSSKKGAPGLASKCWVVSQELRAILKELWLKASTQDIPIIAPNANPQLCVFLTRKKEGQRNGYSNRGLIPILSRDRFKAEEMSATIRYINHHISLYTYETTTPSSDTLPSNSYRDESSSPLLSGIMGTTGDTEGPTRGGGEVCVPVKRTIRESLPQNQSLSPKLPLKNPAAFDRWDERDTVYRRMFSGNLLTGGRWYAKFQNIKK